MNTREINRLLHARCRESFLGTFASDRLPARLPARRPLFLVVNTDPHNRPGEHWIAIYVDSESKGEFFDSLCQPTPTKFANFLDKCCASWKTSSRQLQSAASRFCGHYCIFYCVFRSLGFSLNRIESCFTNDTGVNDVFVHGIICNLK